MLEYADIVIIGGSAAGLSAAITARRHNPDRSIALVRRDEQTPIPCGIPYIYGTFGAVEKNILPTAPLDAHKVELIIAEVTGINRQGKSIITDKGELHYDKLILSTGSTAIIPPLPGANLKGVVGIDKNNAHLEHIRKYIGDAANVVIIGGGFIGIEFADEINKLGGKTVTVVEMQSHCLSLAYDDEFCKVMEDHVSTRGVKLQTGVRVTALEGNESVQAVALENGERIKADLVIMGIGAKASTHLATECGLEIGPTKAIAVNKTQRTSDPHIFAAGDCAEKTSLFDGSPCGLKLASIATLEGRIAAANLYGVVRTNPGTLGVWSTAVGGLGMATAGLTEREATQKGYNVVCATVAGPNRHPGCMPGMAPTTVKLVFEKKRGILLGGQVMGDSAAGEIVNIISACILGNMDAQDIACFQVGTHPALTASPVAYHLVNAAEMALTKM